MLEKLWSLLTLCCSETGPLSQLIDERDDILNNLEIAETRYITSFSISTPEQSIAESHAIDTETAGRRFKISRPSALMPYVRNTNNVSEGAVSFVIS